MTDHEKTCIRLGKWTPGQKCTRPAIFCHRIFYKIDDTLGRNVVVHRDHDFPCPTLTSDDISEWLRKEDMYISVTYHEWDYIDRCSKYIVGIWDRWHGKMFSNGEGPTMLAALENAVAQLPEAKE